VSCQGLRAGQGTHRTCGNHRDVRAPVTADDRLNRPVQERFVLHTGGCQLRQDPLSLAEGVAKQNREARTIPLPSAQDLAGEGRATPPAVHRQTKGGLTEIIIS